MATFVRNRVVHQLTWAPEEESTRIARREVLCELDGLLAQLEEINVRGGAIPRRVLVQLRRRGVVFTSRTRAPELIEAIFTVQETYMRQPDGIAPGEVMSVNDLRRRMAS
ncbi:MAG: hypothetical protein ABR564_07810 [Candidatus Dormibacteria bacterium]